MEFKWEDLTERGAAWGWTQRAKVYGGWLVRTMGVGDARGHIDGSVLACVEPTVAITFVKDSRHKWTVCKNKTIRPIQEVGSTVQKQDNDSEALF